ncbi:amphoterin-induced protein 3 [Lates calcarifer]|uniref:Adhesion molecule with Ig like domain 3 n=1 Tax=Lates calcarifer TaxID=8187 RepID=A0A4W6FHS6_LATCA|nr:amphoterin-induced protein 3 [Lates calcarifer]
MLSVGANRGFLQGVVAPSPSWWTAVVLFVCLSSVWGSSQTNTCLCASDILSCTALGLDQVPGDMPVSVVTLDLSHNHINQLKGGAFQGLSRLETLRLAHNQLTTIHLGAFQNTSGALLRHLDLSSNQLRVLEQHYFQELSGLEELLLFNNRIVQVEGRSLAGLGNLRKAYLSHNRLTHFPFFSIQEHSHPHLTMLDLSSNRLLKLPLEDITNLPLPVQEGLYLHNNSLECECSMYGLFRRWKQRGYTSVSHFLQEHTCWVYGIQKGSVRFLLHGRYFEKCNLTAQPLREQESSVSVGVGKAALLHCVTTLTGRSVTFLWVSPNQEYVAPPGNNGSLRMFTNGSLEIVAAQAEDSGVYWCMALDQQQRLNETHEVNVTVVLHADGQAHDSFNTGFTTLLGCVVSLVLVLMYLYLTPCRCPPCPKPPTPAANAAGTEAGAGSAQSSILTPTPPATTEGPGRKVSTNKHVVFLEPIREQQNGRLRAGPGAGAVHGHLGPGLLLGPEQHAKLQAQQRAGETDSIMSVFSDTPIMLP